MRSYFREYALPLLLFAASVVTTTATGARFMHNFIAGAPPVAFDGSPPVASLDRSSGAADWLLATGCAPFAPAPGWLLPLTGVHPFFMMVSA